MVCGRRGTGESTVPGVIGHGGESKTGTGTKNQMSGRFTHVSTEYIFLQDPTTLDSHTGVPRKNSETGGNPNPGRKERDPSLFLYGEKVYDGFFFGKKSTLFTQTTLTEVPVLPETYVRGLWV